MWTWQLVLMLPHAQVALLTAHRRVATSVGAEVSGVSAGDGSGERALQGW